MFDGGEWDYKQNMDGNVPHVSRYCVETPNSDHDIRLYINGNLDDDLAKTYGEQLASFLNGPQELVNKIRDLERRNLELQRVSNERSKQIQRLETALTRLTQRGVLP